MQKIALIIFIFVSIAGFLTLNFPTPIKIEGDGVFYYSWLHTVFFDRDIDIGNQLAHYASYDQGSQWFIENSIKTPTEMTPNPYAFGSAIIWSPAIAVAHGVLLVLPTPWPADGFSLPYVLVINLLSLVFGVVAGFFVYKTLRFWFTVEQSFLAVTALIFATPWIYYQQLEPFMSHLPSLMLVSLWWYLLVRQYQKQKTSLWLVGVVTFLMVVTRWQHLLFLIAYVPLLWSMRYEYKKAIPIVTALTIPVLMWLGLQAQIWHTLYGSYFLTPQGSRFVRPEFHGLYTLFSSNRGLLLWSPVLVFSFAGLLPLWEYSKSLALAVIGTFVLQWVLNSSLNDLGGGDAFGGRRFIETLPFLAVPLVILFQKYWQWQKVWVIVVVVAIIWNIILIDNYRRGVIPRSGEFEVFTTVDPLSLIR
jgi:hypothetical protein